MYVKYLQDDGEFKEGNIDITNKEAGGLLIESEVVEEITKEAYQEQRDAEKEEESEAPVNSFAEKSKAIRLAVNGPPRANPKAAKAIGKQED